VSAITLTATGGWSFVLHDGRIAVQPINGGELRIAKLLQRIRASTDIEIAALLVFDTAGGAEQYAAFFGGFAAPLDGVTARTVAPTGPPLSIPFGLLLTAAASPDALPTAP
jgi:hypothetical protein